MVNHLGYGSAMVTYRIRTQEPTPQHSPTLARVEGFSLGVLVRVSAIIYFTILNSRLVMSLTVGSPEVD